MQSSFKFIFQMSRKISILILLKIVYNFIVVYKFYSYKKKFPSNKADFDKSNIFQ
jgi:hypothetical protein